MKPAQLALTSPLTSKSKATRRSNNALTERKWQRKFLAVLRKTPDVKTACRVARIARSTAYRRKESDELFSQAWDDAINLAVDNLAAVAFQRAADGDSNLITFLLRCHRPEIYRDTQRLEVDARHCGVILLPEKETKAP